MPEGVFPLTLIVAAVWIDLSAPAVSPTIYKLSLIKVPSLLNSTANSMGLFVGVDLSEVVNLVFEALSVHNI